MPTPNSKCSWLLVAAYAAAGLVLGLSDPWLGRLAQQFGVRAGMATAVSVNVLMPLAAIGLGLAHARFIMAWIGAIVMMCAFVAGLSAHYAVAPPGWSLGAVVRSIPPMLIVATLGYAVLGSMSVWLGPTRGSSPGNEAEPNPHS
jgi:hypothetical protein